MRIELMEADQICQGPMEYTSRRIALPREVMCTVLVAAWINPDQKQKKKWYSTDPGSRVRNEYLGLRGVS